MITIDAKPGVVRSVLSERSIDPLDVDYDDERRVTEVILYGRDAEDVAMRGMRAAGLKCWRGAQKGVHSDPTYAQAAQHLITRQHRMRTR